MIYGIAAGVKWNVRERSHKSVGNGQAGQINAAVGTVIHRVRLGIAGAVTGLSQDQAGVDRFSLSLLSLQSGQVPQDPP